MRVVLDSSVLVAAHISRAGVCAELVEEILLGHDLVLSEFILDELKEKLLTKFGFPKSVVALALTHLKQTTRIVEPTVLPPGICRDPDDIPVLGTAVAGETEVLVTVDKDLLALESYEGIAIIKPGEFWRRARG